MPVNERIQKQQHIVEDLFLLSLSGVDYPHQSPYYSLLLAESQKLDRLLDAYFLRPAGRV